MYSVLILVHTVIQIYVWVLIAAAIMSWLISFNVVNTYNRVVASLSELFYRLTDPALRPIRRMLPNLGGIDISPVILILLLYFINNLIYEYLG
ncbi:MAG TPA: YggT family protein [Stellaceae bacterium]|nr:YggT family protein [Stellaceae bacterium]